MNETDEAEKAGGMRTRLSTGSIHLNGTTTIAVAREIENNQRLQGKSPKDVVGVCMFSSWRRIGYCTCHDLCVNWVKTWCGCNRNKNYIRMSVDFWLLFFLWTDEYHEYIVLISVHSPIQWFYYRVSCKEEENDQRRENQWCGCQ